MENKTENTKVSRLTLVQVVLGVFVLVVGGFVFSEVVEDRQNITEVESMEMATLEELVGYQEEVNKMQDTGVAVDFPFESDKVNGVQLVGRIKIPKIGVDESVVLGTYPETLKLGVGIMEGSDIPLGNSGESSILVGQRGYLLRGEFFKDLDELEVEDELEVHTEAGVLTYKVIKVSTVAEDEVEKVLYDGERTLLALVTSNPLRKTGDKLLVESELVEKDADESVTEE